MKLLLVFIMVALSACHRKHHEEPVFQGYRYETLTVPLDGSAAVINDPRFLTTQTAFEVRLNDESVMSFYPKAYTGTYPVVRSFCSYDGANTLTVSGYPSSVSKVVVSFGYEVYSASARSYDDYLGAPTNDLYP